MGGLWIDEGQEGEAQGNKKFKSCQRLCNKQASLMEVIFLGLVFLFDRLSLRNSVLQPKPLEVSSVHHDAMRLSIDIKMSFVS